MKTTTKERPIIFTGDNPALILAGRKTQTRRVVTPPPPDYIDELHGNDLRGRAPYNLEHPETGAIIGRGFQDDNDVFYRCPYGNVGDRLWVRETWLELDLTHRPPRFAYRANVSPDGDEIRREYIARGYPYKWRSPLFMPRLASRITLEVTGVRIERLRDISEADAIAEGIAPFESAPLTPEPKAAFAQSWEAINAKRGFSWESNPWVWVIEFEVVK